MSDNVNTQSDDRKQYEEKVKLGILMDNLMIKPKEEIFPEGMGSDLELLPMKERMPKPPHPMQEIVDDIKYAWASSKEFVETKLIPTAQVSAKNSYFTTQCIMKLTYKRALALVYTVVNQSQSYLVYVNRTYELQDWAICMQNRVHESTQYLFSALSTFFAMCFALFVQRPLKWYMQSGYRPEIIMNTLRNSIPSQPLTSVTSEVRRAQDKVAHAYELIRKSLLQKMLELQAEMCPVINPICSPEEHEVATCFTKIANDPQKIVQCIDSLDAYKQCVDSHIDRLS